MNESRMLQITGGAYDRCWWAGLTSVILNPLVGIAIAGGPKAYWDCIWAD